MKNPLIKLNQHATRRRRVVLVIAVISAVILAVVSVVWLTRPQQPSEPEFLTVYQFYDLYPYPSPAGKAYVIQDLVVESHIVTTPGLSWNVTGDFAIEPSQRENFTLVEFESFPNFHLHFLGNQTADFPVGQQVRFNITFKEWVVGGQTVVEIEHDYVLDLLHEYDFAIQAGDYRPFETNITLIGADLFVNFTTVEAVYPLPANWSRIRVVFLTNDFAGVPPPGNSSLYDDGVFVALFTGNDAWFGLTNGSADLPIDSGQGLRIPYDGTYEIIQLFAPVILGTIFIV